VAVICGIAAVMGIVLAYRDRAGRNSTNRDTGGASPFVQVAQGQPWPEPKLPDSSPLAAVAVQPKRDEPVQTRVEVRPEAPPEEANLDRKAAYARLVAALDRVEAAAVQKYGRKPQADDKAEFTIPYKAFVNTQTQVVRKRLAKDLGVSEREIDLIKAEGDKAGWPRW